MRRAYVLAVLALGLLACGAPASSSSAKRGRRALAYYGCGSCHQIPGVAWARGRVGPVLAGVAQRSYVAGRISSEPADLLRFIRFPDQVDPQTAMPNLGVSERDARDMTAYLYGLR